MNHTVKMLKTVNAYDNLTGERKLSLYREGEQYQVTDSLLKDLIEDGAVALVNDQPSAETRETKVVTVAEKKPMTASERKAAEKAAKAAEKAA